MRTKSWDMLKTITWEQFGTALLPVLIIYYLVVLLKHYKHELVAFFSGRREPGKRELAATGATATATVVEQGPEQGDLFLGLDKKLAGLGGVADDASPEGSPEMFKVMETVVSLLKGIIAKGVTEGADKDQLFMEFSDALSRYQQLRDTPYQHAINGFLERTCSSNFSLVLDDADLASLWG